MTGMDIHPNLPNAPDGYEWRHNDQDHRWELGWWDDELDGGRTWLFVFAAPDALVEDTPVARSVLPAQVAVTVRVQQLPGVICSLAYTVGLLGGVSKTGADRRGR